MAETFDFDDGNFGNNQAKAQLDYESIFSRMQNSEPTHKLSIFFFFFF